MLFPLRLIFWLNWFSPSILGALAAGVAIYGAISGSRQQSKQYKAYARANALNAAVLRERAEATTASYGQREEQQRRAARLAAGERNAAIAQSGAGFGGSNEDLERQNAV